MNKENFEWSFKDATEKESVKSISKVQTMGEIERIYLVSQE